MAHRAAPISVSIAQGRAFANAVKATAGDWSIGSSASLTFPLHSHLSSAIREGSKYHFKSLWYDSVGGSNPRPTGCEADTLPLGHYSLLTYSNFKHPVLNFFEEPSTTCISIAFL